MTRETIVGLEETSQVMSGGFEQLPEFTDIVSRGVGALPDLFQYIDQASWPSLQAIWTIAAESGEPIEFTDDQTGKIELVRATIKQWGAERGYV